MIFSVDGSIEKIKLGTKTQTRRPTDRYQVGKTYAIQPGRTKPGIPEGRIKIVKKWKEEFSPSILSWIPAWDADAEGGYKSQDFELLYQKMYPNWTERYAYEFEYVEGGQ
jgi:hypothetical protein